MANKEDNLIPFTSDQSREQAKINGKKGGIASAEAKRRRKQLKKTIEMVMSLGVTDSSKNVLTKLGVEECDQNMQTAIIVAQAMKAVKGDSRAAELLFRYAGEDPVYKLEKEKYDNELKQNKSNDSVVEDWISSIPDEVTNDEAES